MENEIGILPRLDDYFLNMFKLSCKNYVEKGVCGNRLLKILLTNDLQAITRNQNIHYLNWTVREISVLLDIVEELIPGDAYGSLEAIRKWEEKVDEKLSKLPRC